jgi:formate dehydrogenase major subunit
MSSSPSILINGKSYPVTSGESLIEAINRSGTPLPQVCYHHKLGPIQTCDTCMVEVDGKELPPSKA